MNKPRYPSLFQLNTRVRLTELSRQLGRKATLDDLPDSDFEDLVQRGFDWIWLLGVWQTGEAGKQVSRTNPEWQEEFRDTLPDLKEEDIPGSCFAIYGYTVHKELGGNTAMKRLLIRVREIGLKVMLDFVPNHMAPDHPWVEKHPDFFIEADEHKLAHEPQNYFRAGERVLAFGRDPYFAGWPDTVQLNYANAELRSAMLGELLNIAKLCDGVRCDMAMLIEPEVFERTWQRRPEPFWKNAISQVKSKYPDFVFMAEVYWDMEWQLQQQGFDYAYDKRLYDRLREKYSVPVRQHLVAGLDYQDKLARFLENHDEPRAAKTFSFDVHRAAAAVTFLTPGIRFFHHGQFEGRVKRIAPHLGRGPDEPTDEKISGFYQQLLSILKENPVLKQGNWRLLDCGPALGENGWNHIIAFSWEGGNDEHLVVAVNYSPYRSGAIVRLEFERLEDGTVKVSDLMSDVAYERPNQDLQQNGIYVGLEPWQFHVLVLV